MYKTDDSLEVKTQKGVVKGKNWKTWKGRSFFGFTGIPYAKPPVGELRFKPPVPVEPWEGILDATKSHNVCTQIDIFAKDAPVIGSEDCLFLNVYTPQLPRYSSTKELLPVMFYIHGGSFVMGSGRDDWMGPEILLDKDIVLVVANYRLGALGFLSTGDEVVPGNNGFKDQNLALKWVYRNIAQFGGNSQRITIFGNSAGAACTHFHTFSPLSRDILRGAIIQSGSALAFYAVSTKEDAVKNAFKLGPHLGYCGNSTHELIQHLRKVDAHEIVRQETNFYGWDNDTTIPFKAVIEPHHPGAFLTEPPLETLRSGKAAQIPLLTGIVAQEGAFKSAAIFGNPELVAKLDKHFGLIAPLSFGIISNLEQSSADIRSFYFGGPSGTLTKSGVTDMYSDGWFVTAANTLVGLHFKYSSKPVYQYLFDYRGSASYGTLFGDPDHDYGVCHTDELLYLLNRRSILPHYKPTACDIKMSDLLTTFWTNFAYTGNPTPVDGGSIVPAKWTPVQSHNLEYLHIQNGTDVAMTDNMYSKRRKFWKSLPTRKIQD